MANTSRRRRGGLAPVAFERILEVTRQLAAPFELRALLAQVVDAGREVLGADRGSVFLYDAGTDELATAVATGVGELRFPADRGIVGECARSRRVINVPDCYADPRFNPEGDRVTGYRTRCLLAVPLVGHDDALVGVLQLLNKRDGIFDETDERTAEALAAQCAVALQRVQMTSQLVIKEKMDRELALAREIQLGFLPRTMPAIDGYDVAGLSRPAEQTGGDTFDLISLDRENLVVLLGDATGHGIGPALSVTQVRSMLRIAMRLGASIEDTFRHINDQLVQDVPANRGVTAFLGLLDARTHTIRYHSGGQGPILHFHAADGRCEWLGPTALPLGFFEQRKPPQPSSLTLAPGDVLGLITDGVYEWEDPAGEQFGREGVGGLVATHHDGPMAALVDRLVESVERHASGTPQGDDVTIVLVRRT